MWHAWHIYNIWWFKAICPAWCDWFCRVLCSLKPLCVKRDEKKEKLHLDKTNCSVYVFNVLCSACFSMEWNIPNRWLVFTKWISNTRPKHMQHDTHTHTLLHCEVKHTEEIKTVWLLMDGLMKDEKILIFFCFHRFIYPETKCPMSILLSQHTNTHTYVYTHSSPTLVGRWWQLTWDIQDGFIIVIIISHPIISMDPSSSWFSAAAG